MVPRSSLYVGNDRKPVPTWLRQEREFVGPLAEQSRGMSTSGEAMPRVLLNRDPVSLSLTQCLFFCVGSILR